MYKTSLAYSLSQGLLALALSFGLSFNAMATGMKVDDVAKEWEETKADYEKITGKGKPSESILGIFRKSSGIDKALKKVVDTNADVQKEVFSKTGAIKEKTLKKYKKAVDKFQDKKKDYLKTLQKAMDKEKDEDDAYSDALKMLKDDLEMIETTATNKLKEYTLRFEEYSAKEQIEAMEMDNLRSALKQAQVFVSKYKANPDKWADIGTFNNGMKNACRNVTQVVGNMLKKHNADKIILGAPLKAQEYYDALVPWANDARKLGAEASEQDKLDSVTELEEVLKQVDEWSGFEEAYR